MENRRNKVSEAVQAIQSRISSSPRIAFILGSGLGVMAEEIEQPIIIPYQEIPHFPRSTVEGHTGQLVMGTFEGQAVIAMQGRFHYYEGYSMAEITFPVYVFKQLGVESIILTNAAGGMNRNFHAGDLMIIQDHINFMGDNPLIGPNMDDFGPRFPDMSQAYSADLIRLADRKANDLSLSIQKGIYAGISGPTYMTPHELMMLARVGADAVGMSTVPEAIAARHCGLNILGISCITDMAIGEDLEPLTHEQVVAVANQTRPHFIALIRSIIAEL